MHDIFIIEELLQHILSFIPRKLIILSALTCKSFYNAIVIDYNQDSVGKNSDMFSLLKIPYSPKAMINIAAKYNNKDMVIYLLENNKILMDDYDTYIIIGKIGYEKYLGRLTVIELSRAVVGMCEGLQIDLFEKYKSRLCDYSRHEAIKIAYKLNFDAMINSIMALSKMNLSFFEESAKTVGTCARENENDVLIYVKNLIDSTEYYLFCEYIDYICEGLIIGNHYDIFVWFTDEIKIRKYSDYFCHDDELVFGLIKNNYFKMFCYLLSNNCMKITREGYYTMQNEWSRTDDYLNYRELVNTCIDYRRIEILTFLIEHIRFNLIRYQKFLNKSQLLKFDDVTNALISNKHLFIEYEE